MNKLNQVAKAFKSILFKPNGESKFYPLQFMGGLLSGYTFGSFGSDYSSNAFAKNPYVFTVVNRIVERAITIPKQFEDNNKEILDNLDTLVISLAFDNPNAYEQISEILYRYYSNYLINGGVYLVSTQQSDDDLFEFFVPNTKDVIPETQGDQVVKYYNITYRGQTKRYEVDKVDFIKRPNVVFDDTINGLSNLEGGRYVWESNNLVWKSEADLHKNKGISGVLSSSGNHVMTPTEKTELQDEYNRTSTGDKFASVKVLTTDHKYTQMGLNATDLKSIESRIDHLRAICALYNVDSKLFNDPKASTYNNMEEAEAAMLTKAVLPLLEKLDPPLINFILKHSSTFNDDTINWVPNKKEIPELKVFTKQKNQQIREDVRAGILSTEEAKEIIYPDLQVQETNNNDDSLEGDSQAEQENRTAQANLRGSVGGVQGILEIQQSVSEGNTSRSSAMSILQTIYGFDAIQANEILG